jgi:tetratricopeptide (TPR) repeat protein
LIRSRRAAPQAVALALAGLISLLPVANIIPLDLGGGAFAAERFLVFPLALFVLAAVALGRRSKLPAILGRLLIGAWLAGSLVVVERTLPRWRDDLSLWTWVEKRAPHSATPPTNIARFASRQGDFAACLVAAQRAVALDPRADPAWNLTGHALMQLGRHVEAESAFARAAELRPESGLYRNNVAGALIEQKRYAEAERILLDQALPRDRLEPAIYTNLGIVYLLTGRPQLAVPQLAEALRLVPQVEKPEAEELLRYARSQTVAPPATR